MQWFAEFESEKFYVRAHDRLSRGSAFWAVVLSRQRMNTGTLMHSSTVWTPS